MVHLGLTCESKWPTWSSTDLSPTLTLAISSEEINHNAPERHSIPTEYRQPGIHRIIDSEKYSKLNHLLRVTAYVLRFIALLRKDKSDTSGPLTAKELNLAERIWTHSCQSTTFPRGNRKPVFQNIPKITTHTTTASFPRHQQFASLWREYSQCAIKHGNEISIPPT